MGWVSRPQVGFATVRSSSRSFIVPPLFFRFHRFGTHLDVDVHGFGVVVLVVCVVLSHHQHASFDLVGQALALIQHVELQPSDVSDPPRHRHRPSHHAPHRFAPRPSDPSPSTSTITYVAIPTSLGRRRRRVDSSWPATSVSSHGCRGYPFQTDTDVVGEARPSCTTDDGRGMATCTCSDWNDASRAKEGEEVGEKKHVHGWWRGVARRSVARRHVLHETTNVGRIASADVQVQAPSSYAQKASINAPPSSACSLASLHQQRWRAGDARDAKSTPRLAST